MVDGSDSWLMDTADTKFWICDSLLHLVHKIMANGYRDRNTNNGETKLRIYESWLHCFIICSLVSTR